jgi:chemotaxis response regulator CheB
MTRRRDIIVIGGSAGAYEALEELALALPEGFAASVFVVLHLQTPDLLRGVPGRSGLVAKITRTGRVPVHVAVDGEPIVPAHLYLAPGGRNMLLDHGRVRVLASPKEHMIYPSINALFRTAAVAYGPRVVGVVLSGLLDDGTAGLWEIKKRGGLAIVQSPQEAPYPAMPQSALRNVAVDYSVPMAEMAPLLQTLVSTPLPAPPAGRTQPARVLIVEDEAIVALNLERSLAARGYAVSAVVDSGEGALAAVRADPPDVVLMDICLPGALDGTEAAGAIWEQFGVPVVYVTAHGDAETLGKVTASAPYGYVLKPFDPAQVHVAIQLALDRRDKELPPA